MSEALCQCGCGLPAPLAPQAIKRNGLKKGEPFRFRQGHGNGRTRNLAKPPINGWSVRNPRTGKTAGEHVVIAERALGKPLPKGAEVHHVDGNRLNNSNRNLVICQSSAYHKLLHVRQRIVQAGGDPNTQKRCGHCKRLLGFSSFYPWKFDRVFGLSNRCRTCHAESSRARYARRRNSMEDASA